ncbi:MAG: ArnT family glycosyltransferase [Ktedonobacterales bacterium]
MRQGNDILQPDLSPVVLFLRRGLSGARRRLPDWARQWQLWLVLGFASLLRIPPLARSPFSSDDALLFLEAVRSLHDHLLPGTGIFNSLLALNMPFYTWLLLPFATHPLGMAVLTDAANILSVAGLYLFGARYFSRVAGLIAGLIFATAMYPTWMSLFVWQQTLVPPFILAVFFTLYLGAVDEKRHWLPVHTLLLAALIQIYPLTVTILPLTILGIILGWRAIRPVDIPLAVLGPAILFWPTYLFESASGGYDLRVYQQYLQTPARVDTQVLVMLRQAIGALPADYLGEGTLYAKIAPSFTWLGTLMIVLAAVSCLWLLSAVLFPRLAMHSSRDTPGVGDRVWRARMLLLVWPPIFLAATIRHASPIYIHYAFIILPITYMIIGVTLSQLPTWIALASGMLLCATQIIATGSFILVLTSAQATAASWGGIPILSFTHAAEVTNTTAAKLHSTQVYLFADAGDPYMGLYWAEDQNEVGHKGPVNWTSYSTPECALTPPHSAGPGMVLLMAKPGPALSELLDRPDTHLIQRIPMARGADYPLYQIAPNPHIAGVSHTTVNGELQFDGASLQPAQANLPARILTSWTALTSTPSGSAVSQYSFKFSLSATGAPTQKTYQTVILCTPGSWLGGEGIVVVFPLPSRYQSPGRMSSLRLRIIVTRDTHYWYQPVAGALKLETAKELTTNPVLLPLGNEQGPGLTHATRSQVNSAAIIVQIKPYGR